ncbi:holin [Streptomyces sp. NPDC005395]|uniref:holin n=1 Tax=Streptomyces sp. NPDC005395 TaxID=3157042 RepID=UPI0033A33EB5
MSNSFNLPSVDTVVKDGTAFAKDLAERTVATFVGAACAVGVAAGPADMFHASFWETMGAAGLAAVFSFLKGLAGRWRGDGNSASLSKGV